MLLDHCFLLSSSHLRHACPDSDTFIEPIYSCALWDNLQSLFAVRKIEYYISYPFCKKGIRPGVCVQSAPSHEAGEALGSFCGHQTHLSQIEQQGFFTVTYYYIPKEVFNEIGKHQQCRTFMECASTTPEGFYIVSGLQEVSQNTPFQARPLRRCGLLLKL